MLDESIKALSLSDEDNNQNGPSLEELNGEVNLPPPPSLQILLARLLLDLAKQPRDIWRLSAPAALLSGVSLLEYSQHYGDHPRLLSSISSYDTPCERLLACVLWYISSLFGSYGSRSGGTSGGYERKPYNPILGEQFRCYWEGEYPADLEAEQVSHHPPVSAFYIRTKSGVHVHGYTGQSTSFTGTGIRVTQEGRLFVFLEKFKEEITITLPELHLFGLTSAPYLEITGPAYFLSTSGWAADLIFEKSGILFGTRDNFTGFVYNNDTGMVEYDIWGNWKQDVFILPHEEFLEYGQEEGELWFNHTTSPAVRPVYPPLSAQSPLESRKVWVAVTRALINCDYDAAGKAKNTIEEDQRSIRRERETKKEEFNPLLFFFTDDFEFLPIADVATSNHTLSEEANESDNEDSESIYSSSISSSTSNVTDVPYNGRWISNDFRTRFLDQQSVGNSHGGSE